MILMVSGVYAVTQYYVNMTVTGEKKAPDYIAPFIDVGIAGSALGANVNQQGVDIILPQFDGNATTVVKEISMSNSGKSKGNYTVVWGASEVPDDAEVSITWCINPYNPERTVWNEGEGLTLVNNYQTVWAYITVKDVGLPVGTYSFKLNFHTV
jgi:hypothetical protein